MSRFASAGIRSDRCFRFDVERASVWSAITRVDQYEQWWPWLRGFDGTTFDDGQRWRCVVKPPLPYKLSFDVTLVEVSNHDLVRAQIDGDISGWAHLSAVDVVDGCEFRLVSELRPASRMLRTLARVARPVTSFGHDWVLDSGARQFRCAALDAVNT